MKSFISKALIISVCIILGIIIAIQYKTVNSIVGQGFIPTQKNKELVEELNKLEGEKETLLNELTSLESKIKKYEDEASEESDYVKELSKDLKKYKMYSGYEEVQGEGIEIIINNPEISDEYDMSQGMPTNISYDYEYLLDIISYLNVSGAEAIAINDLRYTSYSAMLVTGNHLSFNNKPIGAPIIIKAIGKPKALETALRTTNGIIDLMEIYDGYRIEITKHDNITIPRYTEIKEFKYAKPISNEE